MIPGNRKIQKAKPTPFSRPSIEISDPDYKREWVELPIEEVAIGDTVPDLGVVASLGSSGPMRYLVSGSGKEVWAMPGHTIKSFHLVD